MARFYTEKKLDLIFLYILTAVFFIFMCVTFFVGISRGGGSLIGLSMGFALGNLYLVPYLIIQTVRYRREMKTND